LSDKISYYGGVVMYSVKITGKDYDLADFYEVSKLLKKFEGPREEFSAYFSEKIEEFYELTYLKKDNDAIEEEMYKTQLLINDCFEYIFEGKGEFIKYFDKKSEIKSKESMATLKNHKTKINVCYEPEIILEKLEVEDEIELFYYYSFTVCYLNEYIIELFSIFQDVFKGSSLGKTEVKLLNDYLMKIFTVDFEEAFVNFEKKICKYN
jgi:hypothetical protein